AEERLWPRLPVVGQLALGWLERADIDEPLAFERRQRPLDRAGGDDGALRREDIMSHPERGEIATDQRHHLARREVAHRRQPRLLGQAEPFAPVALGQRAAGLLEIVAGI